MSQIGNNLTIAFDIMDPLAHPDATAVGLWLGGVQLTTSVCCLPAFLQMAQRFYSSQVTDDDPQTVAYLDALDDKECWKQLTDSVTNGMNIGMLENHKVLERYGMYGFDEALVNYEIYVLDSSLDSKRILWQGRVDCGTCPSEHQGVLHSVYVPCEEFLQTFRKLFSYFNANHNFGVRDWQEWGERYSRGFK